MPLAFGRLNRAKFLAGLLLFLVAQTAALAADPPWFPRAWQADDGLPDNAVSGLAQTPDGYLWVATSGGLMRFDGDRFEEFSLVNLAGVPNRVVRAMTMDHAGRLWLGMDRGPIVRVEPDAAHVFTLLDGLPDARAASLAEDAEGAVWIAYANGGLARIREGKVNLLTSREGLPAGGPGSLAVDDKGQVWFAKNHHVGVFREGKFVNILDLPEATVRLGSGRGASGIWISAGSRLLRYHEGQEPELRAQFPRDADAIEPRVLFEDRSGALWVGTVANGLFRMEGSILAQTTTSHREISCITEDREGNLWVGTVGGGLNRLRPRILSLLGIETGLPFESVRSVSEDTTGAIWAATQNGVLAIWQGDTWTTVSKGTNWPGGHVVCVAADRQGAIWIGTRDRGLYRWQDGHFRIWRRADGLPSDNIRSVLPGSAGDVWIATDGPSRLQKLHEGELIGFELPPHSRSIRALAEDAAGIIWLGTSEGSLFRVNGSKLVPQGGDSTSRPRSIRCLYPTPDGTLWIGYAGWGVGRLKDGRLRRITVQQGLNDDYISQIVGDDRDSLWLAGNHGIFQVALPALADVAEGRAPRLRSVAHGRSEALPNLQANYENSPGAIRSRDGRLFFPMRTGLAVVHPENIRDHPDPPPVVLERVAADGQPVALYDSHSPLLGGAVQKLVNLRDPNVLLHLEPGHRKLEFQFTALSLSALENVHFRYRIESVDEDWVEAGSSRAATYARLPAGKYRFQVKACNDAGVWNEEGASLAMIVAPFFWQTLGFRITTLAAFTLSLIAVVRYLSFRRLRVRLGHLEQQAALHKERARIAKDIHDDVGANLTQISLLGELAMQDIASPGKAAERSEKISAAARQAIKSLDEIVWAVNPRNDTLTHLLDYAGQFAVDYLRVAGIRCRLDFPEQPPAREVSTDVRHNLFLVIKEALHNIVKHSRATEVQLRATVTYESLEMVIEDDGAGFEHPPDDARADGLRNMRQRLEEIGGQCLIDSRPAAGTKVAVRLPWRRQKR